MECLTKVPLERPEKFDRLLLLTIDDTIRYVLGDVNAEIIFRYIENNYCKIDSIPTNLECFSTALRDLIGPGRGQMLGAARILEETIAETLTEKLGMKFQEERPINFPTYIKYLKQTYVFGF
jgi:hypothetical protein